MKNPFGKESKNKLLLSLQFTSFQEKKTSQNHFFLFHFEKKAPKNGDRYLTASSRGRTQIARFEVQRHPSRLPSFQIQDTSWNWLFILQEAGHVLPRGQFKTTCYKCKAD